MLLRISFLSSINDIGPTVNKRYIDITHQVGVECVLYCVSIIDTADTGQVLDKITHFVRCEVNQIIACVILLCHIYQCRNVIDNVNTGGRFNRVLIAGMIANLFITM